VIKMAKRRQTKGRGCGKTYILRSMSTFEAKLLERLKKYKPLVEEVEMPSEKLHRAQRREFVAEQLIKKGVDKYIAYALAVRKIPK